MYDHRLHSVYRIHSGRASLPRRSSIVVDSSIIDDSENDVSLCRATTLSSAGSLQKAKCERTSMAAPEGIGLILSGADNSEVRVWVRSDGENAQSLAEKVGKQLKCSPSQVQWQSNGFECAPEEALQLAQAALACGEKELRAAMTVSFDAPVAPLVSAGRKPEDEWQMVAKKLAHCFELHKEGNDSPLLLVLRYSAIVSCIPVAIANAYRLVSNTVYKQGSVKPHSGATAQIRLKYWQLRLNNTVVES